MARKHLTVRTAGILEIYLRFERSDDIKINEALLAFNLESSKISHNSNSKIRNVDVWN